MVEETATTPEEVEASGTTEGEENRDYGILQTEYQRWGNRIFGYATQSESHRF